MDQDKKPAETPSEASPPSAEQTAPSDALSKSNEELDQEAQADAKASGENAAAAEEPAKKVSPLKKFFRRFNVYLLLFLLLVVIGAVVSIVGYLNSRKAPPPVSIGNKTLTAEDLKQLANSDATVGDTGQTLTVQGNAVFSGQVLVRSNLNVAGTIQLGNELSVPKLTVSGQSNLGDTQISTLQVASGSTFQGVVTLQNGLNVAGATAFNGPVTARQITVSKLIMSGNSVLEVPNHLAFTGASPGRSISPSVLGSGGSASVNGSDTAGTININTGSGPVAGCFVTLTFNQKFATMPHVTMAPIGAAAGQLQWYVNRSTTEFSLCTNTPAPGNQVFAFDYFITD